MSWTGLTTWAAVGALLSGSWIGLGVKHLEAQDAASGAAAPKGWVCPPCGCGSDEEVQGAEGNCSSCGMGLVDEASVPVVAVLLFEGVDLFSAAGPAGVFEHTARVLTVADTRDPIATLGLGEIVPERTFEELTDPDVLILPSGWAAAEAAEDDLITGWVAEAVKGADHVVAVGFGGIVLAKSGAVTDLELAVRERFAPHLATRLEGVGLVTDLVIVDQGKILSARDATHGAAAACRVLERVAGREAAERVADELGLTWEPAR